MNTYTTPARTRGFVMTEYVVAVLFVMTALLTPVKDGKNAVELLSDAMKREHAAYIYAASLSELPNACCRK